MSCLIAAPCSGSGKTLLSLALASWVRDRGATSRSSAHLAITGDELSCSPYRGSEWSSGASRRYQSLHYEDAVRLVPDLIALARSLDDAPGDRTPPEKPRSGGGQLFVATS